MRDLSEPEKHAIGLLIVFIFIVGLTLADGIIGGGVVR
jgi:hypothetical protein